MDKISIIIPIYNTQSFLTDCIYSVVNQTYKNIEIILVNDGSTDNSMSICQDFAKNDKRIVIIDKANGGISSARNAGIEAATGEYIFFLDGDDFIFENTIELMYEGIIMNNADMAICDYYVPQRACIDQYDKITDWKKLDNEQLIKGLVSGKVIYSLAWNKLYKRSLFDGVRFKVGRINEDELISHYILGATNSAVITRAKLYAYVLRPKSIMHNYSFKRHDKAYALLNRINYLKHAGYSQELVKEAIFRYIIEELNFRYNIRKTELSPKENKLRKRQMRNAYRIYFSYFKYFSLNQHLKIIAFRFAPYFYRIARKSGSRR